MKRSTSLQRGSGLSPGSSNKLKRGKRLSSKGARARREQSAERRCRAVVMKRADGTCERCGRKFAKLDHHHMNRRRGRTPEEKHNPLTSVALCRPCHTDVHAGSDDSANWFVVTPLWGGGAM